MDSVADRRRSRSDSRLAESVGEGEVDRYRTVTAATSVGSWPMGPAVHGFVREWTPPAASVSLHDAELRLLALLTQLLDRLG